MSSATSNSTTPSQHPLTPQIPVARLTGHDGPVQDICWLKNKTNSKYCLTAGHDRSVKLWNPYRVDPDFVERRQTTGKNQRNRSGISSTKKRPLLPHQHRRPDNEYQDLPAVLEIQSYTAGFAYEVDAVCVATNNTTSDSSDALLAACNKTLHCVDIVTAKPLRKLEGYHSGRINAIAAYNQDVYLSASFDTTVALWDGRNHNSNRRPIQILKDAKDSVTDVHVAVESQPRAAARENNNMNTTTTNSFANIRTASVDGCVRTYDLRKGVVQCDDVGSSITSMSLTQDGQCLAVSCLDGCIRLLDTTTGELLNTYKGDHTAGNFALQVDILANDATIVSGSEVGNVVLYDLVRATSTVLLIKGARTKVKYGYR
jgi:mitogen-activated protein kinase organizer 1